MQPKANVADLLLSRGKIVWFIILIKIPNVNTSDKANKLQNIFHESFDINFPSCLLMNMNWVSGIKIDR